VYEHRISSDPAEYASSLLRPTGTEWLLVDDGYPPVDVGTTWDEMGELANCRALPVLRLETRGEHANRAPVRNTGGDVRPLPRVGALGEEPAELVEARRRRAQDSVRMVVDERDPAQ